MGGFSGKVVNIAGASWKGIAYIRILPASVHHPRTEKQVTQRSKFSLMGRLLKTVSSFQGILLMLWLLLRRK